MLQAERQRRDESERVARRLLREAERIKAREERPVTSNFEALPRALPPELPLGLELNAVVSAILAVRPFRGARSRG